jgi:CHAD domain-containing protein
MHESSHEPVGRYVAESARVLLTRREDVIANGPDAVHATRVACRRLRSVLRTCAALWDERHRRLLRDLRWYGRLLGSPRDTEVLEEGLLAIVGSLDVAGTDELAGRLRTRLDADRDAGLVALRAGMAEPRFGRLLTAVDALVESPQWSEAAMVPADRLLPALAYGPVVTVARLAGRLPESGPDRPTALHELRKKAKAARYAYEAIGEVGSQAAAPWKVVTESLGQAQDGTVAVHLLDEIQAAARAAGEPQEAYEALRGALADRIAEGERRGLDALARAVTEAP